MEFAVIILEKIAFRIKLPFEYNCNEQNSTGFQLNNIINGIQQRLNTLNMQ